MLLYIQHVSFSLICINDYNLKAQSYMVIKYNNLQNRVAAVFMDHTQGCG